MMVRAFTTALAGASENRKQLRKVTMDPENCMLGAMLDPKTSVSYTKSLRGGEFYSFITASDDADSFMSIEVTNSAGEVVAKDDDPGAIGLAYLEVADTADYTIKVTLEKESGDARFVALATQSTIGLKGNVGLGTYTTNDYLTMLKNLNKKATEAVNGTGKSLRFRQGDNQWCLVGGLPSSTSAIRIANIELGDTGGFFIGAVHNKNQVNLVVKKGDEAFAEDTAASPLVAAMESGNYTAEIFNKGGTRCITALATIVE